ncbi:MaoC/PaaZ C-terminal domain-containing protein [Streptomyces gilvus]|uniref:MaoC/PaaZ C-terminal domain-containing protein n=1 Tax=Streptomyces gilvus TaxID=2920937 RepID=UPI0027E56929|nr:MaoC/PaaZ C-terminal domain-containing protein [Streptomyces sp. CME 23]
MGETRERVVVEDLKRTQIVRYARASGDFHPLHTDQEYAVGIAGSPGVFAHGVLTMGPLDRVLTEWFGRESPVRFAVRFKGQVRPGETLTDTVEDITVGEHAPVAEVSLRTVNQDGAEVVSGRAVAGLDRARPMGHEREGQR